MVAISRHDHGVTIALQVQPRASRTEVVGEHDDWLKVRVAAPPVDGAANAELVAWLGKQLGVSKSDVTLLSGERGRKKVVLVRGMTVHEVNEALSLS